MPDATALTISGVSGGAFTAAQRLATTSRGTIEASYIKRNAGVAEQIVTEFWYGFNSGGITLSKFITRVSQPGTVSAWGQNSAPKEDASYPSPPARFNFNASAIQPALFSGGLLRASAGIYARSQVTSGASATDISLVIDIGPGV
jgi:hypothetical protein